jgi:hypothetical protein
MDGLKYLFFVIWMSSLHNASLMLLASMLFEKSRLGRDHRILNRPLNFREPKWSSHWLKPFGKKILSEIAQRRKPEKRLPASTIVEDFTRIRLNEYQ